jgi:hypothetical protein
MGTQVMNLRRRVSPTILWRLAFLRTERFHWNGVAVTYWIFVAQKARLCFIVDSAEGPKMP